MRFSAFAFLRRRIALMLITLFGISVVSFGAVYLLPGDPVSSRYPQASAEEIANLRAEMGLDRTVVVQYGRYLGALAEGDFGWSYNTGTLVREDLARRAPASVELAAFALLIALVIGVPTGVVAAVRRNGAIDHAVRLFSIGTLSVPVFWTGLVGIYVFAYQMNWAPAPLGRLPQGVAAPQPLTGFLVIDSAMSGNWSALSGALHSLALPATVLGLSLVAPISRVTRSAVSEALQEDYILFARATGIPEYRVILQDAFNAAVVPLLTILGYLVGYLIAGNALVETVFSWPGIGRYAVQAVMTNDMAPINAVLLILAVTVAVTNLVVDLLYAAFDPRIRDGLLAA